MSLLLALAVLAPGDPMVSPGAAPPLTLPSGIPRPKPRASSSAVLPPAPVRTGRLSECLSGVAENPTAALDVAETWRAAVRGTEAGEAALCQGSALVQLGRWDQAVDAFAGGRDAVGTADPALRARLESMAGDAALAAGAPDRALGLLDAAKADLGSQGDPGVALAVSLDRARALVALKRLPEAQAALSQARQLGPDSAEAWLLSATLSRRMNNLGEAQAQIERAAQLLPIDPEIGLEAGVIAMLSGREAAARKSWESVVAAAPDSPTAQTARGYLAQLGPSAKVARP